ncbi:synaptic vesicular amine transporter-like [Condylostylus longicornis]|uniref:synaptic vesicular amine transporter-like n=1 Tax=Condylostylus longicornis TaxID=2530218 RepID=UPI00244DA48B|nr:synaptic vesicular amine transporter-like [Condylostylus longicornis]
MQSRDPAFETEQVKTQYNKTIKSTTTIKNNGLSGVEFKVEPNSKNPFENNYCIDQNEKQDEQHKSPKNPTMTDSTQYTGISQQYEHQQQQHQLQQQHQQQQQQQQHHQQHQHQQQQQQQQQHIQQSQQVIPDYMRGSSGGGNDNSPYYNKRSWSSLKAWIINWRGSRRLVLVIVAIALLLDNMLLTTVVPIIPEFLYDIRHPNATLEDSLKATAHIRATEQPPPQIIYAPCNCCANSFVTEPGWSLTTESENETRRQEEIMQEERHKELVGETVDVGVMFASKAFVQLLANPFVGPLTHKIGYSIPMFAGFVIMFLSTLIFAFGRSYGILFIARALQGVGSSCSSVSGMGMLADRYTDDKERGNAMGIALGGLALGVLIGPPFGGIMYEFVGKSAPFLVLSALALGDGLLQLFMLQPSVVHTEADPPSLKELVMDPYIIIAAGAITFANMGIAMLEPSLPIWMMDNMQASRWEQGVSFLPASISYLIGTNLFGPLGHKIGRWLAALLGLIIIGVCLILIPMATHINHLILPNAGLGFAIGMVDSCMMPELGYLVDIRHSAVYGSVYAIGDVAFCIGFAVGPALSGTLVNTIGFEYMLVGIAILCFLYAPLLTFLKSPPTKEEKKSLITGDKSSVRYMTYLNEEEEE